MIDSLLELPPHLRERLASALETGLLAPDASPSAILAVLGDPEWTQAAARAFAAFGSWGITGRAAAAWIRSLNELEGRRPQVDLVWSGPAVAGLHARDTGRVYEELMGSVEHSLWASSYVFFDGPQAFATLARRMEALPELAVTLLLNIQRRRGESASGEELVRRFAERFWHLEWPGARRPRVYYDPRAVDGQDSSGVLHAKAIIADEARLFVTSANLTEAGLGRNIELGLLVRDRALARSAVQHFQALIEQQLLRPLPPA